KTGCSTGNATWDKLAPYQLDYMIRRADGLVVVPWTISVQFSNILFGSDVGVIYKRDNTCRSRGDYDYRDYYFIVTNTDGDSIIESSDVSGKWASGLVGDAEYWILVRASDVTGNVTVDSMRVRTRNGVGLADQPGAVLARPVTVLPTSGRGGRTIAFELVKSGPVDLRVLDNSGRVIETLVHGELGAGRHTYCFLPPNAGVYVVQLKVPGSVTSSTKLTALD
ncbi:MAG: hypothetical protein ABIK86_05035, partial [candidate division WOR-3 bacterium]